MSRHAAGGHGKEHGKEDGGSYRDPPTKPRRKRVVLADSRAPVTVLRTVVELEEQTSYGEELVSQFIRTQLRTAIWLWIGTVVLLGVLPALFFFAPAVAEVTVAGVPLPWLLVGVAPFPLFFGAAYWYNLVAERQEQAFVAMVEK